MTNNSLLNDEHCICISFLLLGLYGLFIGCFVLISLHPVDHCLPSNDFQTDVLLTLDQMTAKH